MGGIFSFGSYYPGTSLLHRLDPRTKLLGGLAFIVLVLTAHDLAGLVVVLAFVSFAYALARIPVREALASLAPLMVIVVLASVLNLFVIQGGAVLLRIGPLVISEGGVWSCVFVAARLALMMAGMSLVTLTTQTLDLTEALERLLAPLARVGVPAHEIGMIMGIALRFMPQFASELMSIYRAQVSRGAGTGGALARARMLPALMVPLFTSVFRHAETLACAMDARCYHGGVGRTRLHPLRFTRLDAAALVVLVLFAAGLIGVNKLR